MWTKVKTARQLIAAPQGTRVRIVGEHCADHFCSGGILANSQNVEPGEYKYGIHTTRQTCFKFNFKSYEIWEPQPQRTTKKT